MALIEANCITEICDCLAILTFLSPSCATVHVCQGIVRIHTDGLGVICYGLVIFPFIEPRDTTIVVGGWGLILIFHYSIFRVWPNGLRYRQVREVARKTTRRRIRRWGRISESVGECPHLSGARGVSRRPTISVLSVLSMSSIYLAFLVFPSQNIFCRDACFQDSKYLLYFAFQQSDQFLPGYVYLYYAQTFENSRGQ